MLTLLLLLLVVLYTEMGSVYFIMCVHACQGGMMTSATVLECPASCSLVE